MPLRDGDILNWKWKDGLTHMGEPYWCKTMRAIVLNGQMHDLFWLHHGSRFIQGGWGPSAHGKSPLPAEKVHRWLIANLNDLEEIRHGEEHDYEDEDVIDLRHSNNSSAPVYVRRGATRSPSVMLERVRRAREDCARDIRSAKSKLERLDEAEKRIRAGDLVSGPL